MTLISSLGNDDVIVIKHVKLVSNGSRRTSVNARPLMVNLLFFIVKHWSFTSRDAEECHTMEIYRENCSR